MINLKHGVGKILILMAALVLQGCTFSAPQFDAAVNFAKTITAGESSSKEDAPAVWLASVGERGALLNPYTASGLIVFANNDGDAIAFDGWIIRSITGFGLRHSVSVIENKGIRTVRFSGRTFVTKCGPWISSGSAWTQSCESGKSEIVLDASGNITKITATIGGFGEQVVLSVLL